MKGGRYLNQWRMAQLHAMEAPDRVKELEEWGALFDRTHRRAHPSAQLRRPQVPAPRPRRRPHGPRDDPHAPAARHPLRHAGVHGVHASTRLLVDGRPRPRRVRLLARERALRRLHAKSVVLATGGIGRAFRINSNSWECTGDGQALAYLAGAELMDMEFMQFHPTGMVLAAERARHPHHRGRARRGRHAAQQGRQAHHVRLHPGALRQRDGEHRGRGRPVAAREHVGAHPRRKRTPDLLPRDIVARAIHTEVKAGRGSPHGGVFLDICSRRSAEDIKRKLPAMYHQFKELGDVDITKEPMEVGPDGPLHDGRHPRRSGDAGVAHQGALRRRRVRGGDARRQPSRRQLALRPAGLRAHRGPHAAKYAKATRRRSARRRRDRRPREARRSRRSSAPRGRTRFSSTRT